MVGGRRGDPRNICSQAQSHLAAFGGNQELGSIDKKQEKVKEMLRRRSSNVYCPHNGVLCREEDLTLSAVCSTCAQAHLAQHLPPNSTIVNDTSSKDEVDSASSSSSMKLKPKRVVFSVPPSPEPEHHAVAVAEE